jgi:hypothetical protein
MERIVRGIQIEYDPPRRLRMGLRKNSTNSRSIRLVSAGIFL